MSMRIYLWLLMACALTSCWKYKYKDTGDTVFTGKKVWGYKPVYATESAAKTISYLPSPQPVVSYGNIYAFRNYIFQIDPGFGIHVFDNSTPSTAHKIGFITVKGCSQISIK